ncbi:MAG: hypothetical protein SEPTF4163_004699, partial [Sporothrix epigloea]
MKFAFLLSLVASAAATLTESAAAECACEHTCTPTQMEGFQFSECTFGEINTYNGFHWEGFSCVSESVFWGRSRIDRRTTGDVISGVSHSNPELCPSFDVLESEIIEAFSVTEIHITTEFDCDLEFHYSMTDGSTCKDTHSCS